MKKTHLFLIMLSLISMTKNIHAEETWKQVTSNEGLFSVLMPSEHSTSSVERADYTAYSLASTVADTEYKVVFSIQQEQFSDQDKLAFIEQSKNIYTNSQQGKIVSEQTLSIENNPGFELKFKTKDGLCINYRIFFHNNILYTLHVLSANKFADKKLVAKFFDSFKLLPAPAPSLQNPKESGRDAIPNDHQKTNEKSPLDAQPDATHSPE